MTIGLSFFSIFIAPLIALIAWGVSIIRLRSRFLALLSLIAGVLIVSSTFNAVYVALRNPYLLLVLIALALFNMIVIPYADKKDHPYIVAVDTVLVGMLLALHGWTIYLRQSDAYFYEHSDYWAITFPALISLLAIVIPLCAFISRPSRKNGILWCVGIVAICITLALVSSLF